MKMYNVHAGHNQSGRLGSGAVGYLDESKEARKIKKYVIRQLRKKGNKVYDCTVNNGKNQMDVLKRIVQKANKHKVDLDISIHLNSGRNDKRGDGKNGGCEILCTESTGIKKRAAAGIRDEMKKLGFTDRGTKINNSLYVLNKTKSKAILIEVCFVDDKDDYKCYQKVGAKKIGEAIAKGIMNA